ncbi:leucyl aminopeptidase [Patescibacteria group bacterium]|nr:leucyl aminopeptidase [Patescibacteria group bacterium]MCL5797532.1 leucyl aminopeptidase [Patescibacteria group bacterium]
MKFLLKPTEPSKLSTDLLIQFVSEGEIRKLKGFSQEFISIVKDAAQREIFEGKEGQFLIVSGLGKIEPYKVLFVGTGKIENVDYYNLNKFVSLAIKKAQSLKPVKISISVADFWINKLSARETVKGIIEAVSLSAYKFLKFKGEEEKSKSRPIEEVVIHLPPNKLAGGESGLAPGKITADAVIFARDLVNEPPELTSPEFLANTALLIAKKSKGSVSVKIIEKGEIAKLGMGSFLGVAEGSDKPPKFIHLSYKPSAVAKKKVVIIGKGITFDAGGLSLKPAEFMETMKLDMSGAAAVLGIFSALSALGPKVEVVGLIAACENMPSGRALKPGDILRAMNGKTIEVLNTDAEGRLTLADAISFANMKEKADEIIDLATLTGACMVALGQEIAGAFGNDDKLLSKIEDAARSAAERVWRLPLPDDYKELLKSHIADIKNVQAGRYGGAITASLFLSEFVGKTPWVHLDIAGPAYEEKDTPIAPYGGTGFGVRLLLSYLTGL